MEETNLSDVGQRVGEVVEATTSEFIVQCYRLYQSPPLGGLVRSGDDSPIYGLVYEVATRSMDPGRRPIPRGEEEETEEGVYLSNPQLSRLLATEFRAMVVGHRANAEMRRHRAPLPPRIHSFVYQCVADELRTFTSSLDFVPAVLAGSINGVDDVLASFLRQAGACHHEPERFLVQAGKELTVMLSSQMQRLNYILRRLSP